jgi:hypothetical protein
MNIMKFIAQAKQDNGGSYCLMTGYFNPTTGYMVSLECAEQKFEHFPSDIAVQQYILNNAERLCYHNRYLGLWYNEDKALWYMDVSVNVEEYASARLMGAINKQIAIWDCAKNKEIKLGEDEAPTYARTCSVTGEGMNEGWYYEADQMYFKYEADALAHVVSKGYDDINDAYEHDECYYTEWDVNED